MTWTIGPELAMIGRLDDLSLHGRRLPLLNIPLMADAPAATCRGRRRSPVTMPGYRRGESPPNKGKRFPATPPTEAEVLRMLECCGVGKFGERNRALIVLLWRTGLRISEALALKPYHVNLAELTVTVECGKGGKYRVVGLDPWGAGEIKRWLDYRQQIGVPEGAPLFCTLTRGETGGRLGSAQARAMVRRVRLKAGIPHRVAPHQFRHALAVGLAREKVSMTLVQRQLGHSNLGTTATYLQAIAPFEVIEAMTARSAPAQITQEANA